MTIIPFAQRCSLHSAKTMEGVWLAMEKTDEVCRELKLGRKVRSYLRLITEEACTNAYEYCRQKSYEHYFVYWKTEGNHFTLTVSHLGELFPLPAPTDQPILEERGRGLHLIQSLMDEIRLEKQGEYIHFHLRKRIHAEQEGEGLVL